MASITEPDVDGQRVVEITSNRQPKRGGTLVAANGRPYRVMRRYTDGSGTIRLKLKGRDSNDNVVTLFPSLTAVHERVNSNRWVLYR